MAVFVDLEDEDIEPPQNGQPPRWNANGSDIDDIVKAAAKAAVVAAPSTASSSAHNDGTYKDREEEAQGPFAVRENPNRNSMTKALGCYP